MRVFGCKTLMRNESKGCLVQLKWEGWLSRPAGTIVRSIACKRFEKEHSRWDPKDGDLCLLRVKARETVLEARSVTDVQIVRLK